MKYLVIVDAGTNVFIDEFDTLSEANGEAFYVYNRYQKLPWHCPERKHHIFVDTPADGDDLDIKDNYFDSNTFYLPYEERDFDDLWYEVQETISDGENLDFVVGKRKFTFSVPWYVIEDYYIEEQGEFDKVGGQIIYAFYKEAVREKIDEILSFYELN